eukprot:410815-Rhodomonas_salina.1
MLGKVVPRPPPTAAIFLLTVSGVLPATMLGESVTGKAPAQENVGDVDVGRQTEVSVGRTREYEERLALLLSEKEEAGGRFTSFDEMLCMKAQFGVQSNRPGSDG